MNSEFLLDSFKKNQQTSKSLQSSVYHTLKDAIVLQELPAEITESQISLALDVSRTPVRDAMHRLASEGFLDISHGKKAKVNYITEKDIQEIAFLLKGIHVLAGELCVEKITNGEILQLKEILSLGEFYVHRHDAHQVAYYNTQFHLKICEYGRNKWLYSTMVNLMENTFVFRRMVSSRSGRMEEALKEHTLIFELIAAREKEELARVMASHIDSGFLLKG